MMGARRTVSSRKAGALVTLGLVALVCAGARLDAQETNQETTGQRSEPAAGEKGWQAVAPGLVEPRSGEIRITAATPGRIGEVLVQPKDQVFAGQLLVRLDDEEVRVRLANAEAQIAMRQRARKDQSASGRAAERRRAEDAEFDAQRTVIAARTVLDATTAKKRGGTGSDRDIDAARASLARALEQLTEHKAELRRVEAETGTPLPTAVEGQLNVARVDLLAANAAIEKLMIRAPIGGTVLQVDAKPGELASPSAARPLLVIGDLSTMRVRAEVDERDFSEVKLGQPVLVRTSAFGAREFAGKVVAIAPIVEQSRIGARGGRNLSDVNIVEVLVDLTEPGPLVVGMKVDVYFRQDRK
jgi:HlyD family secretion protein